MERRALLHRNNTLFELSLKRHRIVIAIDLSHLALFLLGPRFM